MRIWIIITFLILKVNMGTLSAVTIKFIRSVHIFFMMSLLDCYKSLSLVSPSVVFYYLELPYIRYIHNIVTLLLYLLYCVRPCLGCTGESRIV